MNVLLFSKVVCEENIFYSLSPGLNISCVLLTDTEVIPQMFMELLLNGQDETINSRKCCTR